ncbi:MAG: hypothetical protein IKA34_04270 [Bacteroidales bacterium]|nr:hypothetical protein [Bacteroidales bacterium]MBR1959769.1 hypothetical protein [Bacteroidales bacterium]
MKRFFAFIAAAIALSSCIKVGDTYLRFDGPSKVSAEEQVLTYIPKHQVEMSLQDVRWEIYDTPPDQVPSSGVNEPTDSDKISGEWFTVCLKDGNVVVELDKNEGYRRKLLIEISETFTKIGTTEICIQQEGKAYEE